MHKHKRYK